MIFFVSNLALLGGSKIRQKPFPNHPIIGEEEKKQVMEVLESGNISTFIASPGENFLGGKKIREFEDKFAKKIGTKFAVTFNSASSALHAAVIAVGVEPGQEVIVPPNTFTSTATSSLMHNAIPIFCDIKEDTYCLDPKKIESLITPLSKAIIPVHLFGHSCDMDEIVEISKKNNLKIIEDCAQSIGAEYKNKKVGTIGDCGIFSFQESKIIMTGEGGMLITNDEEIIGISRNKFCEALVAEGIPCFAGYVPPLYLNPLYAEKRAFAFKHYTGTAKYEKGICPVAESLHEEYLINTMVCRPPAIIEDMQDIIKAIKKILENKDELK